MKKIISVFLLMTLCLPVFSGCRAPEKQDIPFEYSYKILVDKELPDQSLVWVGRIQTPTRGVSILEFPEDYFSGIVNSDGIHDFETYHGGVYYKETSLNDVCKALKISRKDLSKKFNTEIKSEDILNWEDVILYHFYVPEGNQSDGEPTEFAGKYVFIEYRGQEEAYIQALPAEEYNDAYDPFSVYSSVRGRIGNRYYLSNGYYDLTEHKYKLYENKSEIPPYNGHKRLLSGIELLEILKSDEALKEEITERMYVQSDVHIMKDRIYMTIGRDERYYDGEDDDRTYAGSVLLTVMLDADTYEILYAAKYHSTNYNIGRIFGFYRMNKEGMLCDPYVSE